MNPYVAVTAIVAVGAATVAVCASKKGSRMKNAAKAVGTTLGVAARVFVETQTPRTTVVVSPIEPIRPIRPISRRRVELRVVPDRYSRTVRIVDEYGCTRCVLRADDWHAEIRRMQREFNALQAELEFDMLLLEAELAATQRVIYSW